MNLYFTNEICDFLDLFGSPNGSQIAPKLSIQDGAQFQMEIRTISRRRPRSLDDTELGHFTF